MKALFVISLAVSIVTQASTRPNLLAESEKAEHSLGDEPVTVAVRLPESAAATERLRVVLEELKLVRPGAVYEVYLNLPEDLRPDPEGPYFLGHLALFGGPPDDGPGASRSYDVTGPVAALRESGEWAGEIELTFVRGDAERARSGPESTEYIRFSHISVVER